VPHDDLQTHHPAVAGGVRARRLHRVTNVIGLLEGKPIAGFAAVIGLDAVVDPVDHRAVTAAPPGVRKTPGLHQLPQSGQLFNAKQHGTRASPQPP